MVKRDARPQCLKEGNAVFSLFRFPTKTSWFKTYVPPSKFLDGTPDIPFDEREPNVINYVGIRADEDREGYISHKRNIKAVYPFRENGLVRADIIRILIESGLGLPTFMRWGRTRSGCYFCFYQQKIEWVRLKETYPDLFEKAKEYEYANKVNGNPFYWNSSESLGELEKPERMAEIKRNWEETRDRKLKYSCSKFLISILGEYQDVEEPEREGCLICQL